MRARSHSGLPWPFFDHDSWPFFDHAFSQVTKKKIGAGHFLVSESDHESWSEFDHESWSKNDHGHSKDPSPRSPKWAALETPESLQKNYSTGTPRSVPKKTQRLQDPTIL